MITKFTFRNLVKRPFLNLVKILGLSFALTGLCIIALFMKNELSFDHSHKNADRIYRFTFTSDDFFGGKHFARIPNAMIIPQMADYFNEIENYTRLARIGESFIKYGEEFIDINQAFQCDSTFFEVFDCELLIGDPKTILDDPGTMIISESFSKRIFGDSDPIGQTLTMPTGQFNVEEVDFIVQGIMKDYPNNNHFHPDFITSPVNRSVLDGWAWSYILLSKDADPDAITSGFLDYASSSWGMEKSEITIQPHLQNIKDIHLHSKKLREIEPGGSLTVVYTFSVAAILLLFIALINYANLNIGMAGFTDKFMHINKISGATRGLNIKYYLFEGAIITVISIILSSLFADFTNDFIQKSFGVNLFEGNTIMVILIIVLFASLCLLASFLPLLKQSLSNPLFSINDTGIKRKGISKSLIVLQYTVSIALIIAVLVINKQTRYSLDSGMGSDTESLICIDGVHADVQSKFPVFKSELLQFESIETVSAMFEPPGGEANDMFPFELEGYNAEESNEAGNMIGVFPCDYSFASIFNLEFLAGNNFSEKNIDQEGQGEYIINESALKRLGYSNPNEIIGKRFNLTFNYGDIVIPSGKITGVVKDFHFSSLKSEIEPYVFFKRNDHWISNFIISFKPGTREESLGHIKQVWNKLYSAHPFEYKYVSSMYEDVYRKELMQESLLLIFTGLALFICSMGLLGMSLLVTQQRTKEIGIRKVNGASISQIVLLLNWNLIKWIVISFVLSVPLAFYSMNKWLENFSYKTELSWWIFVIAGALALFISLLTISLISWKAAKSNPVKALRYE